ncbi:MAG: cytochrome c3 family protein [Myxococcaceae bacterium]
MSALLTIVSALALSQQPTLAMVKRSAAPSRIDASPHNFFGPMGRPPSEGTDLCMMCHVPNRLEWPKRGPGWDPKNAGRSAALDVRADPSGPPLAMRWAGSTMRCLSCHDGTVSSINIVLRSSSGTLKTDAIASTEAQRSGRNGPALFTPQSWTNEVMGNHPVSVPYPLDGTGSEYKGFGPRAEPIETLEWVADPRAKGLKLVSDTSGFDVLRGTSGVECISCHDPHGTTNTYFLRLPKERSELCLGCHRK